MQSDLPHTLYNRKKKDKSDEKPKGKDATVRADDPAFAMQQEAYERKLARIRAQQQGQAPLTMEDIFGK